MQAGTLHCPCCGAAISDNSTQCQYCRALLQTVACPSCFGLMFLGSKFCPHCGTAAVVPQASTVAHVCPRCPQVHLQAVTLGGVPIEECRACGGMWIASSAFEKVCADRETQEAVLAGPLPAIAPKQIGRRYLKCPQCSTLMTPHNFAAHSGVIIDKCTAHGIWLDRDEMRQIVEFIRGGGLARQREHEIEKLEQERAALESMRTRRELGM